MTGEPILVIDDDEPNRKLSALLLKKDGYAVRTAASAEEAIEILKTGRPKMIVTDVHLTGMDGLELTRRLKADPATRDIVVIVLSASALEEDEEQILASGCDEYLAKTADVDVLSQTVARYLRPGGEAPGR